MSEANQLTDRHEAIIQAWACVLTGSKVAYISGPITTGAQYIKAVRSGASDRDARDQVRPANCRDLHATALALRAQRTEIVVEPASLLIPGWSQSEYLALWERLIEDHVDIAIFVPGWEFSVGCAIEFVHASEHGISTETLSGTSISIEDGITLLAAARDDLWRDNAYGLLMPMVEQLHEAVKRLQALVRPRTAVPPRLRKDESLDLLAERGFNVAQFVSFEPKQGEPRQTFARLLGRGSNEQFGNLRATLAALLDASVDRTLNVRSYHPDDSQSREFLYGLKTVEEAATAIERLSAQGLHTIANETIDVADGGVSGVVMGNVLEFAPDDTPRCVEKPGTASLPRGLGRELLETVYGIPLPLQVPYASRLEFSLHPRPRGWLATNVITWEYSEQDQVEGRAQMVWPNKFSRLIGDKTFGLLIAHHVGLPVPRTTVINRRVAPFTFGRATNSGEHWIRTAPLEQMPGLYPTYRGWTDPFKLLLEADPTGVGIASVLSQAGVNPIHSGALIVGADGEMIIEGRAGTGDTLMLGEGKPERLPDEVLKDVQALYRRAEAALGTVRFEWVHDGKLPWIVQLHRGATESTLFRLTSGAAEHWIEFDIDAGLAALRTRLQTLPPDTGLLLKGRVGLTSHIADVIRKAKIPARMMR